MNNITAEIRKRLLSMQDEKYKEFNSALIPTVDKSCVIGVRMPMLRAYGKELLKEGGFEKFLEDLPHRYHEENNLHGILIEKETDFDKCMAELDRFLPFVDNWATCDLMNPKALGKYPEKLLLHVDRWLKSSDTYTVRFAVKMLMTHFLGDSFLKSYAERVANIETEEYYVKMMCAWYFATALSTNPEDILPFLEDRRLDPWVHNKTIQKARESFRITKEQKESLTKLKIR